RAESQSGQQAGEHGLKSPFCTRTADRAIQCDQCRCGRVIGAVPKETPPDTAGKLPNRFGMGVVTFAVVRFDGLRPSQDSSIANGARLKTRTSGKRKILFSRIDDLHQVTMRSAISEAL